MTTKQFTFQVIEEILRPVKVSLTDIIWISICLGIGYLTLCLFGVISLRPRGWFIPQTMPFQLPLGIAIQNPKVYWTDSNDTEQAFDNLDRMLERQGRYALGEIS